MNRGAMNLIQLFISILLYFVIFFGVAFILNMLLRRTWLMAVLYPIIISLVVSPAQMSEFFTHSGQAISETWEKMTTLPAVDIIILSAGFIGTIASGIVVKMLRKSGYQMF